MTVDTSIDLRRLRYFVAVAKAAGFRQAAAALGMAQPPLSQQVMALEKQLGERLFIRHPRTVELTDAGRALLAEAEPLLARAAAIPERLRRAVTGTTGMLWIGITPALSHHPGLPKLLRAFRAEAPDVDLRFCEDDTDLLCRRVADGHLQAAFVRAPVPAVDNLRIETIGDEPLLVAVPVSHRLARRDSVRLVDLADEDFVMFKRQLAPGLYDSIVAACVDVGISLRVVHHAPQKVSALLLVAGGIGITIVPSSLVGVHGEAVRMIPIDGPQPAAPVALATRRTETSALPERFRRFCMSASRKGDV